jgi:hypothetical protein
MLMFMHHIALFTPCIVLVNGGHLLHMQVDHADPEAEVQKGASLRSVAGPQASSGEDTDLALDQGKPRCIPPKSLSFMFETFLIILFDCALSLHDLYCTIVALGFFFPNILVYPSYNSCRSLELARRRYRCQ